MRPGEAYPSGGATSNMLDVWKAAAPAIDVIAPDIYVMDYASYRKVCESYSRPDNALLIPETGGFTAGNDMAEFANVANGQAGELTHTPRDWPPR